MSDDDKRYLCTLNLGGGALHPNARASMKAAAMRWGADFLEVLAHDGEPSHHFLQKLRLPRHLPEKCRVIYVDADVVVRSDCPDLFEVVPEERFGAGRSWIETHHCGSQETLNAWSRAVGAPPVDLTADYLNGGLTVFSLPRHRPVFEEAIRLAECDPGWAVRDWVIGDQAPLSAAFATTGTEVFWLAPCFHWFGADLWERWSPTMRDFVWHFCGPINKQIAAEYTCWQDLGPDRFTRERRTRWQAGKPVMLGDGGSELPFLHQTARLLPRRARLVEVGTWFGGSLYHFLKGTADLEAEVHCVDHWHGDAVLNPGGGFLEDVYEGFLANLRDLGDPAVTIHRAESEEASRSFGEASLDLVYVDGSHDYEDVVRDLDAWLPKLKPGAIMAGHDYSREHFPGVVRAVDERFGAEKVETSAGGFASWRVRVPDSRPRPTRGCQGSRPASSSWLPAIGHDG